jgi:intein/homing endonuclease
MGIKYRVNEGFFKTWTPEMAYTVGFIAADGSLEDASYLRGKYLRVCSSDLEILKKIQGVMYSEHKIVVIKPRECLIAGKKYISREKYMLRIGSHGIYNDLVELGITPHKSKTINLPKVPLDVVADFLRGYLDGDGCINSNNKNKRLSVTFTSGSELFLEQLSKVIGFVVGGASHKVFSNKRAFQIKYSTREAIVLLRYIYSDCANELYLERKYKIFLEFLKLYPRWQGHNGAVPKRLRELSAKQLFTGSSPVRAS